MTPIWTVSRPNRGERAQWLDPAGADPWRSSELADEDLLVLPFIRESERVHVHPEILIGVVVSSRAMYERLEGYDVTELLHAWAAGDQEALDVMMDRVYDRMRLLAASFLRHEREDHTLQTTALIHEAFLRLIEQRNITYENREQFFANAGRMMRRILVDHARARSVQKRGSGAEHLPEEVLTHLPMHERPLELAALDEALEELAQEHPELSRIVELKFFVGLTVAEVAVVSGQSTATTQRRWRMARAWLFRHLAPSSSPPAP